MLPPNEESHSKHEGPAARKSSPAIGLFIAALLVFLLGSLGAWLQPTRLFPLQPLTSAEWWLHPVEQNAFRRMPRIGADLRDVFVVPDTGEVWAVGDKGLIVHSQDGGRTWTQANITFSTPSPAEQRATPQNTGNAGPGENFNLPPPTQQTEPTEASEPAAIESQARQAMPALNAIVFTADGKHGWAVGSKGAILASADGGQHWSPQASGTQADLNGIAFAADSLRGWAVGTSGTILASNDGGRSWNRQASGTQADLKGVAFAADAQRGWAVGTNGTKLASADGGRSWNPQNIGTDQYLEGVAFTADGQHGWAVGSYGRILASDDGGRSWDPQTSGTTKFLKGVTFAADGLHGWAVGTNGTILASSDGGRSWNPQTSGTNQSLTGVALAADGQHGWIVGDRGTILSSSDGGRSWERQASGTTEYLSSVAFAADGQLGWAVGENGIILASSDGGRSWNPQASGTTEYLSGVAFAADGQRGWAVGENGIILASSDGGRSWNPQTSGTNQSLTDVAFAANGLRGWAVGWNGTILASTDGGESWNQQASGTTELLSSVALAADGQRGWAVGGDELGGNAILASSDGGRSWNPQAGRTTEYLSGVASAADGLRGWAVGIYGTILASSDGGQSWNPQTSGINSSLLGIAFAADGLRGWAVGEYGTILASSDGGGSWNPQASGTTESLSGVAFAADGHRGLVVGNRLTLLTTTDGGNTWSPVPYHRYPAPWYWLVCLLALTLAGLGTRKPQEGQKEVTVADMLASDRPLQVGDADPLHYAEIAAGVSRFLRNPKTLPPLTVAVTGEWGTGKSSLMNLLREDLKRAGFTTVWFNAWHHQKGEQLLASLFANLRAQAIPPWFSRSGPGFRWNLLRLRSLRHSLLLVVLLVLISAGLAYLAADFEHFKQLFTSGGLSRLAFNIDSLKALLALFGGFGVLLTALVSFFTAVKGFGLDPAKLIASVSSGLTQRKPIEPGARYQFAEEFADVTHALAPGRLVIFIDDLDRCSKENVLEVLESINFLVSSGDCFIVLGMSREWVETCVGLSFKELAEEHNHGGDDKAYRIEFARKYLQKLINIEVPLPKMDTGDSLRLLPDQKTLPEPGNRLEALWDGTWGWLRHHAIALMLLGLVVLGVGGGLWLAPQISQDLDWMSGKINGTAEIKGPPEEIPLSSGFELTLVEANGGAVKIGLAPKLPDTVGKTDTAADNNGQLLLRASPEALDKGVVLGKLGDQDNGAELVLKRLKPPPPAFVGPIQPASEPVIEPGTKPETQNNEGPAFTSGAMDASPLRAWAWTPTAGLLLALGLALLLRSPVKLTQDSEVFVQALKTWHPLIAASCPTPRMVKRYLNWVRFLAMRYRPVEEEKPGIWSRMPFFRKTARPAEATRSSEDKAFDEKILVALSAIYQFRREWVGDSAQFGELMNGSITTSIHLNKIDAKSELDELVKSIKQTENVQDEVARAIAAERLRAKVIERNALSTFIAEALASLTPEDWQKAANQRPRFIEAVGDVEVS